MKPLTKLLTATALTLGAFVVLPTLASAADGDWKMGRVYYRFVCTACHKDMAGKVISPNDYTKAEWMAYWKADKHDATGQADPRVTYYASQAYRESIKDENKAAAKFLPVPDADMEANLRAWTNYGAKDSDTASSCQ